MKKNIIIYIVIACVIGVAVLATSIYFIIQATKPKPTTEVETISNLTDLTNDTANWMSQLPSRLKKESITRLAIPGAHRSFTTYLYLSETLDEFNVPERQYMTMRWYQTQEYNITELLKHGIRYLDFGFCANYRIVSTIYSCIVLNMENGEDELKGIIKEIQNFLKAHTEEIVVLDCYSFEGFAFNEHLILMKRFETEFKDTLLPYQDKAIEPLTLDGLNKDGKQVFIIYRDRIKKDYPLFWGRESFVSPSYSTKDPKILTSHLDQNVGERSWKAALVTHLVLTPLVFPIFKNFSEMRGRNETLYPIKDEVGIAFLNIRNQWIVKQKPGPHGVNIIVGDYVNLEKDSFIKNVINVNLKLLYPTAEAEKFAKDAITTEAFAYTKMRNKLNS